MSEVESWNLLPRIGLGEIRFGMNPDHIESFSNLYGQISGKPMDLNELYYLQIKLIEENQAIDDETKQEIL